MSIYSGSKLYEALKAKYEAEIMEAKANIEIYLDNKVGVAEHPDSAATIEGELAKISEYDDKLEALKKYF